MDYKEMFSFENACKIVGAANKRIYGVNPFEKKEAGKDSYWEHSQHDRNRKNCSECYKRQQAYYKLFGLNFNNPNINPLD